MRFWLQSQTDGILAKSRPISFRVFCARRMRYVKNTKLYGTFASFFLEFYYF